ncbi:MAG: hypothetical protein QXD60_02390 [Nanopusillaceae archaeon]
MIDEKVIKVEEIEGRKIARMTIVNLDKNKLVNRIEEILREFDEKNGNVLEKRDWYIREIYSNLSIERLKKGWFDEKGQPLSNLLKRYIPKEWKKIANWNDCWSRIVNEAKRIVVNQELTYWEREVDYFDSEEYRLYNWGDSGSCFREGRMNEIVAHILRWNSEYVKLGLFELKIEEKTYLGRLWVFKFKDCVIATNFYCSLSDVSKSLLSNIVRLVMEYNGLKDWEVIVGYRRPFKWFYWNSDEVFIVPRWLDIDEAIDAIEVLPLDLNCSQYCGSRVLMYMPWLDTGIVYCHSCKIGVCRNCGELTYSAIEGSEGAYCEDCSSGYDCARCGRFIREEDAHYVNGDYYCDMCFREYWTYCAYCEDVISIDEAFWTNSDAYCEYCFERLFVVCEDCGEIYDKSDRDLWVYCKNEYGQVVVYCKDCADVIAVECDDCGSLANSKYTEEIDGRVVCRGCLYENYSRCVHCNKIVTVNSLVLLHGQYYCRNCAKNVKVVCNNCKKELPIAEAVSGVGLKVFYCVNCFVKIAVDCSGCGAKVLIEDTKLIEGKRYCLSCADRIAIRENERILDEILNS